MVVGFTAVQSVTITTNVDFSKPIMRGVIDTTLFEKVYPWFTSGRWFSPGTSVSSTNKINHHNITVILLKGALNTINPHQYQYSTMIFRDQMHCWWKVLSVRDSTAVDHGLKHWSGQTKKYCGCNVSTKHAALRSKNKSSLTKNQENEFEWRNEPKQSLILIF
jgi:hypothetical protein